MKDSQFIKSWEKYHKRGPAIYILGSAAVISLAALMGKIIGEYLFNGILFKHLTTNDFIGLIFLSLFDAQWEGFYGREKKNCRASFFNCESALFPHCVLTAE